MASSSLERQSDPLGLREAKKRRARAALRSAGIELFEERGFAATRIVEITERAQVSHATFFNYFAGKDGLFSDWLAYRIDTVFARCADDAASAPLRPAVRRNLREFSAEFDRRPPWLQEAWSRCRVGALLEAPRGAEALVKLAQERGDLRRDVSSAQLAGLLMVVLVGAVGEWLATETHEGPLHGHVLRAVDLVLDGARRRSERVRPRRP